MDTNTQPADELLVERGNAAEHLLTSEPFQLAANTLTQHYLQAIIQSAPENPKAREVAYAQARSIQDIVGVLNQWVAIRDQIIANNDDAYEEPDSI